MTPAEIEMRVKRLTSLAEDLFRRGSWEAAFESLMKAYFLDPASPHVAESEQHLMPTLEMMRRRGSLHQRDLTGSAENVQLATLLVQRMDDVLRDATEPSRPPAMPNSMSSPYPETLTQHERIEALKKKNEQIKKEHEQQIWRKASSPPNIIPASSILSSGLQAKGSNLPSDSHPLPKNPGRGKSSR